VTSFAPLHLELGLPALEESLAAWAREALGAERTLLYLWHEATSRLERVAVPESTDPSARAENVAPDGERMDEARRALETGTIVESRRAGSPGASWRVIAPLSLDGERIGALVIDRPRRMSQSLRDLVVELQRHAAAAVRNSRRFARAEQLSFTDDLTSLYNSRFMSLYLDREVRRSRRAGSALSLLFMDLDGFKAINDVHGHLAGSATLVEVGGLLTRAVRDSDIVVRYGGDEFVIVFPETPLPGGLVIAERIREAVARHVFLEDRGIEGKVSTSVGLASYPAHATEARDLIQRADDAMYQAKAQGKNRVVTAAPAVAAPAAP
jgi:diguanylate cyclase (GGDEF)-like protein